MYISHIHVYLVKYIYRANTVWSWQNTHENMTRKYVANQVELCNTVWCSFHPLLPFKARYQYVSILAMYTLTGKLDCVIKGYLHEFGNLFCEGRTSAFIVMNL